jgi:hypothetical protein
MAENLAENLDENLDKKKKKLELSSETLRSLEDVTGGAADCTCGGCYCTGAATTCVQTD